MRKFLLISLSITAGVALFLSPFASSLPDGLEKVVAACKPEDQCVARGLIPDYKLPGVRQEKVAVSCAGIIGTLATCIITCGLGIMLVRKKKTRKES